MEQIKMIKDGAVKLVTSEEIKDVLLAAGWVVEGEEAPARRGRPRKDEE